MLSIIIPSVNDPVLQRTIDDIRQNAKGGYRNSCFFDGRPGKVQGAKALYNKERIGLRGTVNRGGGCYHRRVHFKD